MEPAATASAIAGPQTAPPLSAAPSASIAITDPTPGLLAWRAYGYVLAVQRDERLMSNADLAPTVCPLTFAQLELSAAWAPRYQANAALAAFVAAVGSIAWSCDRRDVAGLRSGVRGLSALLPPLTALASPS